MTDYRPIDCHTYGEYEQAIMARRKLRAHWRDESGLEHLEIILPTDLETCRGEEFLHARNGQGRHLRVRLDRIVKAIALPAGDG